MPLAYWPLVFRSFSLPKAFIGYLIFSLLAMIFVARVLFFGKGSGMGKIPIASIAFAFSLLLSTVFSVDKNISFFGSYRQLGGVAGWWMLVVFSLSIASVEWTGDRLKHMLKTFIATSIIVSLVALLQYFFPQINMFFNFSGTKRPVYSTLGNANYLGAYLSFCIPLLTVLLVAARKQSVFLFTSAFILSVAALAFTGSRGSWLAVILPIFVLFIFFRRDRRSIKRLAAFSLLALVIFTSSLFIPGGSDQRTWTPAQRLAVEETGTIKARAEYWKAAANAFVARPVNGWGPDTFGQLYPKYATARSQEIEPETVTDDAHNLFLQLLATLGIISTGGLIYIFARSFKAFFTLIQASERRDEERSAALTALTAGSFGYLIAMQSTINSWGTSFIPWLFVGIIASFEPSEVGAALQRKIVDVKNSKFINLVKAPLALSLIVFAVVSMTTLGRYISADIAFARGYLTQNNYEAIEYLNQANNIWPGNEFYLLESAKRLASTEPKKAEEYAIAASRARPLAYEPYQFLAEFYNFDGVNRNNSKVLAVEAAREGLSRFPGSHKLRRQASGQKQK